MLTFSRRYILLLTLIKLTFNSYSQNQHKIDSLENELKKYEAQKLEMGRKTIPMMDTIKANILFEISKAYSRNFPDKALEYAQQSLSLSEQIGYKNGMGNALNCMGGISYDKGNLPQSMDYYEKALKIFTDLEDKKGIANSINCIGTVYEKMAAYPKALEFYKKSLQIRIEIGDQKGIAGSYNNIGMIFIDQGNYPEALQNMFNSLKIKDRIGDKSGTLSCYVNIGRIYEDQHNYPEALKIYQKALEIGEEINDKLVIASCYNNIGDINERQGNAMEGLKNFLHSIKIKEEIGDKKGMANSYNNIGLLYYNKKDYSEALKNFSIALRIREDIGDKKGIASSCNNMTGIFIKQGNFNEALKYDNRALSIALEIGAKNKVKDAYQNLAEVYAKMHNYQAAYENHVLYKKAYDSLYNSEVDKKLSKLQLQYDFDKKQDSVKSMQAIKDALSKKEVEDQKVIRNTVFGGSAIIVAFLIVVIIQRNKIAKERRAKALEMERARISRDLHDDLGSGLSRVSLLSQLSGNYHGDKEKLDENLDKIKSISQQMTGQLNEMIWSVNPAHDTLAGMLGFIRNYVGELLEENDIAYNINFPDTIPDISITPDFRMNVYSITKEAVNNALKYAQCHEIRLDFSINNPQTFTYIITDDGKGFDLNSIREFGNGMKNMKQRAKESGIDLSIETSIGKGTKIILIGSMESINKFN